MTTTLCAFGASSHYVVMVCYTELWIIGFPRMIMVAIAQNRTNLYLDPISAIQCQIIVGGHKIKPPHDKQCDDVKIQMMFANKPLDTPVA